MWHTRHKHKREPLTRDEANRLANSCTTFKEKLVIWTLLDTGMRVEEFCNLEKQNIEWDRHKLKVFGKNTTGDGTGKKARTIPMTDRIKPLLKRWIAENDVMGMTTRTANRIVHRVGVKSGIPRNPSPHILRHTFAVLALEKGVPIQMLQEILGHEDINTTMIYLNSSSDEMVRVFREKW